MKKNYSFLVVGIVLAALIGAVASNIYNDKKISDQLQKLSAVQKTKETALSEEKGVSGPKIGVLNMLVAAQNAKVYQYVLAEKAKYEEKYQKEFDAEKKQLQEKETALVKKRDELNKDGAQLASEQADIARSVFEEKQKQYQKRVADFQKEVEAFQKSAQELQEKYTQKAQKLAKSAEEASNEIVKATEKVLTKINEEEKFDLILNQTALVFYSDGVNITDRFVKGLDEVIQKVDFKDPEKQTL